MAVITFDVEKNSVCVLVEKSDIINTKEDNIVEVSSGAKHVSGKIFVNGEIDACIVRGERQ
jgi:hypothetical protein